MYLRICFCTLYFFGKGEEDFMRKLCKFIFSRYFISAVMILAELLLFLYLLIFASNYSPYAFILILLLHIIAVLSLANKDTNPEYKVSWLIVILLIPFFGVLLYSMFYSRKISRKDTRFMENIYREIDRASNDKYDENGTPCEKNEIFAELSSISHHAAGRANALLASGSFSELYKNTESEYFAFGENMYERMLEDMRRAEKYIFLEYFIIEDGEMWQGIYKILKEKATAGVDVRIIYDDIGCMKTLPRKFDRKLREFGIKALRFAPVSPRVTVAHNNRDHRKILVIDGKVAYTGGINIADEYINKKERFGHWKDGGVRVFGMAVEGFLKLFLSSWDYTAREHSDYDALFSDFKDPIDPPSGDGGFYIPFSSGPAPLYESSIGKGSLIDIINQSCDYVYITTPYLIIDYDLTEALRGAAKRGVDVRIITPGRADKKLVKIMTKSSYPHLMEAGVKIYEYLPGFIHEKLLVSDDKSAVIGTINFDYRSLVHHFEDALWIYSSPTVIKAKEEFLNTISVSDEIDEKEARLSTIERLIRNLMRVFAPLL